MQNSNNFQTKLFWKKKLIHTIKTNSQNKQNSKVCWQEKLTRLNN